MFCSRYCEVMPISTNFSIICGPCLQQWLPRCFHGDFLFSSVLLHLLFGICEGSFVPLLHLFIFQSFVYISMDSWTFIIYGIIHFFIYLIAPTVSILTTGSWEWKHWFQHSFGMLPSLWGFLNTSFTFWRYNMIHAHLVHFWPQS